MDRIQLRRDTSQRWRDINPVLLEGEVGIETDTRLRKVGDGANNWNNLDYLAAENVAQELGNSTTATISQKVVTENFEKNKFSFLPDRSFSGNVNIDYNHLVNILTGGGFDEYKESEDYDCAWVQIYDGSDKLEITGCVVRLTAFFRTLTPTATSFINQIGNTNTPTIPEGAKLAIIDLEKVNNPNGYIDMRVSQSGAGASFSLVNHADVSLANIYNIPNAYIHRTTGMQMPLDTGVVKCCDYMRLNKREDLIVRGRNGGGVVCGISFYDEDKRFISSIAETTAAETDLKVALSDIPTNAVYFRGTATMSSRTATVLQGIDFGIANKVDKRDAFLTEDVNPLLTELGIRVNETQEVINGTVINGYVRSDGTILITSNYVHTDYYVNDADLYRVQVTEFPQASNIQLVQCFDRNNNFIQSLFPVGSPSASLDALTYFPLGTARISVNWRSANTPAPILSIVSAVNLNIKEELDRKQDKMTVGNIKVHIYGIETPAEGNLFYIRAPYNRRRTKDVLLVYYTNNNGLISPKEAYIGNSYLTDSQLMSSTYLVSSHSDSTAPFFNSSIYWHLFAQHGYVIPRISNTINMTSADVGAKWRDQLNREYTIGDVTSTVIQLLPVIIRGGEGNDTRGWKTPNDTAIATLSHIEGGVVTTTFTTSNLAHTQLRPIMKVSDRKFMCDGREIFEAGDYYCDDFQVSESQVGYDPATIDIWFPQPVLDNALEMARFTWSYNFKGAQCCVNTTIDVRRKIECQSYGATQQQTFWDTGNYKAMFMLPKAAARNGIEYDKPFSSPDSNAASIAFYRNSTYLKDPNKLIDRLIGFLHNPNTNEYLVGMAAGLSLVSGDTVEEKRRENIPILEGTSNSHWRLGSLSPSNRNKFYVAAVNTSPFQSDNFRFPNTFFKEINYYVSYFDPSENTGQVYWYKDGNQYVIYAHCQTTQDRIAINLPSFMEGLSVEVVEKTDGATLHTTTIQNGRLLVSYNQDANYIVVKTN